MECACTALSILYLLSMALDEIFILNSALNLYVLNSFAFAPYCLPTMLHKNSHNTNINVHCEQIQFVCRKVHLYGDDSLNSYESMNP